MQLCLILGAVAFLCQEKVLCLCLISKSWKFFHDLLATALPEGGLQRKNNYEIISLSMRLTGVDLMMLTDMKAKI